MLTLLQVNSFPLYFEAANDKGLSIAGLNFPDNAQYHAPSDDKCNVTPFELPLWLLGQCKNIKETKKEYILTNQLIRSGTSIGANICESKYAQSTADFISKMQIALKECYESEYWLELLNRTKYIDDGQYKAITNSCGQIRRMLISSINTAKNKI